MNAKPLPAGMPLLPFDWPRRDPITSLFMCESCWNGRHRSHSGLCGCDCTGKSDAQPKFTDEGQTSIPMNDMLEIKADS